MRQKNLISFPNARALDQRPGRSGIPCEHMYTVGIEHSLAHIFLCADTIRLFDSCIAVFASSHVNCTCHLHLLFFERLSGIFGGVGGVCSTVDTELSSRCFVRWSDMGGALFLPDTKALRGIMFVFSLPPTRKGGGGGG